MEGESPTKASTPAGAVFLSYASQDAEPWDAQHRSVPIPKGDSRRRILL